MRYKLLLDFLRTLCYELGEEAKNKGFSNDIKEQLLLINDEVSEATRELRKGADIREIIYFKDSKGNLKPTGFSIELADIILRVFSFCGRNNINISEALEVKIKYNKTREYKHGKEF